MLTNAEDLSPDQQRKRLELVVEGTRLGMWDWNPQTNEVIFNDLWAEMLGYDIKEISQSLDEWQNRVHPDDLEACYADIAAHLEGKTDFYENIHRMKHRDGRWVYILDRGKIVERDEEGRPIRFTGTHTDITREKEAELKAIAAMEAKSMFLANMSHEIRTPLNGIMGLLQLLERSSLSSEQREWIGVIMNCSEGLLTVINDVLDLSKFEAGNITINPTEANVRAAFKLIYELYKENALSKGLDYRLKVEDTLPQNLIYDEQRVKQVVLNLVSNAVKFTQEGSVLIDVSGRQGVGEEWELLIRISDTGKGIVDPESIWDRYKQETNFISKEYGGTGLGLAISRNFVDMMDGELRVESVVGEGSTFEVCIPVKKAFEAKGDITVHDEPEDLEPLKILVAEDNSVNQLVIRQVLANLGMPPQVVTNGIEAIAACELDYYDLIFMDLHMPKMGGLEATHQILSSTKVKGEPRIVGLSADAITTSQDVCMASGMSGFVMKPFKIAEIISELSKTVRLKKSISTAS